MSAARSVKDTVLSVLKSTSIGRTMAAESEKAEAKRQARVEARSKLEEARAARERIPALADAVEKAQAVAAAEAERLSGELYAAQRAHNDLARSSDIGYTKAAHVLRRTAAPSVSDSGPVVRGLDAALLHLRSHFVGTEEDVFRRQSRQTPRSKAPEDTILIDDAKALITTNDEALELTDEIQFALDELRDLQLEVEADPASSSKIVEALPAQCIRGCSHDFAFESALASLEAKEA